MALNSISNSDRQCIRKAKAARSVFSVPETEKPDPDDHESTDGHARLLDEWCDTLQRVQGDLGNGSLRPFDRVSLDSFRGY